jgi:hypothetical protein
MGRNKKRRDEDQTSQLLSGVEKLVQLKTSELQSTQDVPVLKYMSIFCNLDRMLCKLPESVVEDLNMKIMSMVYDEVKKLDK